MPELTEFLLERIAGDQEMAEKAAEFPWDHPSDAPWPRAAQLAEIGSVTQAHIARWDPARVLAECEAKRHIIAIHTGAVSALSMIKTADGGSADAAIAIGIVQATIATAEAAMKYHAAVYSNHPDYDENWRPDQ
jgi:hypothetical protein